MTGQRSSHSTRETGLRAEALARRYLEDQGFETIACNYRCRMGELDLIMRDGREIVLVEVRYRRRADPVQPWATVTATKQRRLLHAAAHFLQRHPEFSDAPVRFDVLALSGSLAAPHFQWFRAGFDAASIAAG